MTGKIHVLKRHWQKRKLFVKTADWVGYLYNRLLRRLPRLPLPGRGSIISVRLRDHQDPFYVRLGTTDLHVLEEMFHTGEYVFVKEALKDVKCILDLGANVGFSIRYRHEIFPAASIIAVEPDGKNFLLCVRNVEAAHFSHQVKMIQARAGSSRRMVQLGGSEEWSYRMQEAPGAGGCLTEVLPLSEILEAHAGDQTIDLLKCDIEGAEQELFKDCRPWISRIKAIAIELHLPYSAADLAADLKNAGAEFDQIRDFPEKQNPVLLLQNARVAAAV